MAFAVLGYMSPDFWLTRKTTQRRDAILAAASQDALDMLRHLRRRRPRS